MIALIFMASMAFAQSQGDTYVIPKTYTGTIEVSSSPVPWPKGSHSITLETPNEKIIDWRNGEWEEWVRTDPQIIKKLNLILKKLDQCERRKGE